MRWCFVALALAGCASPQVATAPVAPVVVAQPITPVAAPAAAPRIIERVIIKEVIKEVPTPVVAKPTVIVRAPAPSPVIVIQPPARPVTVERSVIVVALPAPKPQGPVIVAKASETTRGPQRPLTFPTPAPVKERPALVKADANLCKSLEEKGCRLLEGCSWVHESARAKAFCRRKS
jgi:hypothetical protein